MKNKNRENHSRRVPPVMSMMAVPLRMVMRKKRRVSNPNKKFLNPQKVGP